ncbi:MAG: hypothetical protein J5939_03970 [Bacteroidales bacterium]|nr:hypothetical protein [Bacteroidales bacterium]
MKKIVSLLVVALLSCQAALHAQNVDVEVEFFHLPDSVTDSYLDSLSLPKQARPNHYWMVGGYGGVSLIHAMFNPTRTLSFYPQYPVYGFSIVRHATMMNMFPNLGMEFGFQHNYEGYRFKKNKQTGITPNIEGAYEVVMEVPEVFLLTHGHLDIGEYFKILVKAGIYGGYRMNISRSGPSVAEEILNDFKDTDLRYSYGVQGGLGFGLMFDPFEFHLNVQVKWGWGSFFQPDYLSPYYYRFAYPLDGAVTFGVYYQLTPRHGHTRSQLRRMARNMVENP